PWRTSSTSVGGVEGTFARDADLARDGFFDGRVGEAMAAVQSTGALHRFGVLCQLRSRACTVHAGGCPGRVAARSRRLSSVPAPGGVARAGRRREAGVVPPRRVLGPPR